MIAFLILVLFAACHAHVIVHVRPGVWPAQTPHLRALGGNRFVVDDAVANKLAYAIAEKTTWHAFDASQFPSERGAVVRFAAATVPKDVLDVKRASKSPNVFSVGNKRISITDPVVVAAATKISGLAGVLGITPRHAYRFVFSRPRSGRKADAPTENGPRSRSSPSLARAPRPLFPGCLPLAKPFPLATPASTSTSACFTTPPTPSRTPPCRQVRFSLGEKHTLTFR